MRMNDLLIHFLNHCRAKGLSPATLKSYEVQLSTLSRFLNNPQIHEVSHRDIERYLIELREKYTPGGVASRYGTWSTFFSWCAREEELEKSPLGNGKQQAPRPKTVRNPPPVLDERVVLRMLEAVNQHHGKGNYGRGRFEAVRDQAVLALLYDTGMRADEICGLMNDDVSLSSRQVLVHGKGGKKRAVRFGSTTAVLMGRYVRLRHKTFPAEVRSVYFWLGRRGYPWQYHGLYSMVKRAAKTAGIVGRIHPHLFRHTFAHQFLLEGGNEGDLMRLMGHSSTHLIQELYGASAGEARARAAYDKQGSPLDLLKKKRLRG